MANGSIGMSGNTFDAFVSSQRNYSENDWAAKIQEKYWRARQKFLAKVERNEDSNIVLSDSKLDAKLEIYKSIDRSCARLTNILENYQNSLFMFSNEENALGILLKECGKHDKTKAGKIMALTGRSLTQSSHQRIRLYMPLMRLYQEMETFHSRAVEDTAETVGKLESKRSQYRASLLWMKDISEKLDPDIYRQLDKFRRVQNKVREDKKAFDGMQMDVVQKIDLLMASRCNLMNQILAPYQAILLETFERNYNNFKSIEEHIKREDLYEYEFKALKQLNPLKISDSPVHQEGDKLPSKVPSDDANLESKSEVVIEQDLLGAGDLEQEQEADKGQDGQQENKSKVNRYNTNSLVDVNGEESGQLEASGSGTKEIDLLESLFGQDADPRQQEGGEPTNQQEQGEHDNQMRQRKHQTKHDNFKAMRFNLDANLLDIEGDEDKQIASLLGPSMNSSHHATNLIQPQDPLSNFLQEDDIFSKWARDADTDLSGNNNNSNNNNNNNNNNTDGQVQESPNTKEEGVDNNDDEAQSGPSKDLMDIEPIKAVNKTRKDRSRFYA